MIAIRAGVRFCPNGAVREWLDAAGITSGLLFPLDQRGWPGVSTGAGARVAFGLYSRRGFPQARIWTLLTLQVWTLLTRLGVIPWTLLTQTNSRFKIAFK